ncbi:contractile injection system tape measure protein [Ekhidna sp.]
MGGQQHKLKTLLLEVQAPESSDTFVLHRRCSDVMHGALESVLKEVCDEFIPENVHLRLESLPLDLGDIMLEDLEEEMPKRTREKLRTILPDILRESDGADQPQLSEMSPEVVDEELLLSYLKTGAVPWWAASGPDLSIETILDRMTTSQADQLKLLLSTALKDPKCIRRMVMQCSLTTIEKVANWLMPNPSNSTQHVEFDSWLIKRMWNSGLVSVSIQEMLERYLEFLVDNPRQEEAWVDHVFRLMGKKGASIQKLIDDAPTSFRQQIEESWKRCEKKLSDEKINQNLLGSPQKLQTPLALTITSNASEENQVYDAASHDSGKQNQEQNSEHHKKKQAVEEENERKQSGSQKGLKRFLESEIASGLFGKWEFLLKQFSKEEWTSFLKENLMYGIGSTEWMDKITDDQLRELFKILDVEIVNGQEVLFLVTLFKEIEIPGTIVTHVRRWIWEKAFLRSIKRTDQLPLLHSVLGYIAGNTEVTYQDLVTNVHSAIQQFENRNTYVSSYDRLLSEDESVTSSFSKKEEKKSSLDEQVNAWLMDLQKAMDQGRLDEVEHLIYQMHAEGKFLLTEEQRKALVRMLVSESRFGLIQQFDHILLVRITYLTDADHVVRFVPLIEDLMTICLVYEKNFISSSEKAKSLPTTLLMETKEWLWKSIWTLESGARSADYLIKGWLEQIASFQVKPYQKIAAQFARIVTFLEDKGHTFSSSLSSFFATLEGNDLQNISSPKKEIREVPEHDTSSWIHPKTPNKTSEPQVDSDDLPNIDDDMSIIGGDNENSGTHSEDNLTLEHLMSKHQTEEYDQTKAYFIDNAGVILLASFLPAFFKNLGLLNDTRSFVDEEARIRAIHLVQFLVSGETQHPEHLLTFNKLICGLPLQTPVPLELSISKEEKAESDDLLTSVINNWSVLKNTSIEGLRTSFLQRQGKLSLIEDGWRLDVEERPYDMLLEHLPWGINICTLPWNDYFIYTEWHHN